MANKWTWYKVDNVAKVFLASANRRDPRVFRVSCTLNEPVDPAVLQQALDLTIREQPQFQVTLHRGLFWHYLEATDQMPVVEPENGAPCLPLYGPEYRYGLLYRVSYFGARINMEFFHAIADGTGGFNFLMAVVHNYLTLCHPKELADVPPPDSASADDRTQDDFHKYYRGDAAPDPGKRAKKPRVFRIRSQRLPYDQQQFFEAHLSTSEVLQRARALGVSLTSYLGAALMLALRDEMPTLERKNPVVISMPVNLRNYYASATARNFFNSVNISHTFSGGETLEELAPLFDAKLKEALKEENIRSGMDNYEKLERITAIRLVPLFIKNRVVNLFSRMQKRSVTAVLSNVGRIRPHPALGAYIKGFVGFNSASDLFTVITSYGDDLVLATSSVYRNTNVLRRLYRAFAESGLEVTLYATEVERA